MSLKKLSKPFYTIYSTLAVALLMVGCSVPTVEMQVTRPAEYALPNIRDVAVGHFALQEVSIQKWDERKGKWTKQNIEVTAEQRASFQIQIRNQLLRRLQQSPSFTLYFLDELEKIQNDKELQAAIQGAEGTRIQEMDAVVHGQFWLDLILSEGADLEKAELVYNNPNNGLKLRIETLVSWPYQSIRGSLSADLKLTRISPTNIVAAVLNRSDFTQKIGGHTFKGVEQVPIPIEQVISYLAVLVADEFTKKIAVHTELEKRQIDENGNARARQLLIAGAYEEAIRQLEELNATNPLPANLYNLGLGYEAVGEQRLAWLVYGDALRLDPDNALYAEAIGSLENILSSNRVLRQQITESQQ